MVTNTDGALIMPPTILRIGYNLRRLRLMRGVSQSALAKASEIGRVSIVRIESGSGNPSIQTLDSLACALGADPSDFLAPPAVWAQQELTASAYPREIEPEDTAIDG